MNLNKNNIYINDILNNISLYEMVDAEVCEPSGSQPVTVSNRSSILPNEVGTSQSTVSFVNTFSSELANVMF